MSLTQARGLWSGVSCQLLCLTLGPWRSQLLAFSLEALLWKKFDHESQVLPARTLRMSSLSHNFFFFSVEK